MCKLDTRSNRCWLHAHSGDRGQHSSCCVNILHVHTLLAMSHCRVQPKLAQPGPFCNCSDCLTCSCIAAVASVRCILRAASGHHIMDFDVLRLNECDQKQRSRPSQEQTTDSTVYNARRSDLCCCSSPGQAGVRCISFLSTGAHAAAQNRLWCPGV